MPQTGEGKTGEATTGESAQSFTYIGEPTGQGKTGEEPTGGTATQQLVIAAPKRTLDIQRNSHDVTGAGTVSTAAPKQTLTLERGSHGITEIVALAAPKQTLTLERGSHDVTGAGTVSTAAPKQTLAFEFGENKIGYPQWVIAGEAIRVQSVTLTPTSLSLDIRARTDAERTLLDTLDANAGKLETRERADGTTLGRDLSGGSNTFTIYPPIRHAPERVTRTWLCDNVSRDRTSADTRGLAATLEFVAEDTRSPVTGLVNTSQSDYWEFDFGGVGTITTPRVSAVTQETTTSLGIILTAAQAELFETTAAATAGAVVTTVPDGTSFTRDATPGDRQTVTITPPTSAADPPISPGEYVIEDWTSEGADGEAYRVTMQLSSRFESG